MSRDLLRDFEDARIIRQVVSKFIRAIEFPNEKAFRDYMKDHPKADPDNHSVVLDFKPPAPPKPKLPPPPAFPRPKKPKNPRKPHKMPKLDPPPKFYKPPTPYTPPKLPDLYEPPAWLGKKPLKPKK